MHFPPFKGLLAFDAVARIGSVSKAAEELNLTVSAVSHQIASLEAFVARQLFDRSSRGLTLTIHGERFQRDIAGALILIATAANNVRSGAVLEVLRIHAVPSFAGLWLLPRLPSFRLKNPDVRVQLTASYGDVDFLRGEIDIDIRYGSVSGRDLHVESLFPEEIMPMMSPALRSKLDVRRPEDLLKHDLIRSQVTLVQWSHWFAANGVPVAPNDYVLSFDRTSMVIDAAIQGLGIALDSSRTAGAALKRGELVPVFVDRKGITVRAHHLVYPRAHSQWDRVAKFTHWLREEVAID